MNYQNSYFEDIIDLIDFLNKLIKCKIDKEGCVIGTTPEDMGQHILYIKCHLMQKLIYFSAFLYQYIDFSVILEVASRRTTAH